MTNRTFEKAFISDIDGVVVDFIFDEPGAKERTQEFLDELKALRPNNDIIKSYKSFNDRGFDFYFVTGRPDNDDCITKNIHLAAFGFKYRLKHASYKNKEQYIHDKITEIEKIVKKYKYIIIIDDDINIFNAVEKNIIGKYTKKEIHVILYPQQAKRLDKL